EKIGSYPINDPDGYYTGFAGSGYGIMWNKRYLKAKKIPDPKEWAELKKPVRGATVTGGDLDSTVPLVVPPGDGFTGCGPDDVGMESVDGRDHPMVFGERVTSEDGRGQERCSCNAHGFPSNHLQCL
ncbi:MAG: hypothetical protein GY704_00915, partial [Phycisphaeraceae bacterium]|nr:hypothetical protein [Phycisphaeraceae bacterium]